MRIDAHQHFWKYAPADYPWMTGPREPLRRDYVPTDLQPLLTRVDLKGSIAVQAQQTVAEARWLLQLARQHAFIRGVVGWVDLCSSHLDETLTELKREPKFVGVRHVVQDEPDDAFMLRPDFQRGVGKLRSHGLTYDILIYPRQLPAALELVRRFPEQPFVVDHMAKPHVSDGILSPWREQMMELARSPNVLCKVSGLVTEASWQGWKPADFRPYLDVVFEAFGPERLMFGSDWPVCTLAASYEQVYRLIDDYTHGSTEAQRAALFGGTAERFYNLSPA